MRQLQQSSGPVPPRVVQLWNRLPPSSMAVAAIQQPSLWAWWVAWAVSASSAPVSTPSHV